MNVSAVYTIKNGFDGSADSVNVTISCRDTFCENETVDFDLEDQYSSERAIKKIDEIFPSLGISGINDLEKKVRLLFWKNLWKFPDAEQYIDEKKLLRNYEILVKYKNDSSKYEFLENGYIIQLKDVPVAQYRLMLEKNVDMFENSHSDNLLFESIQNAIKDKSPIRKEHIVDFGTEIYRENLLEKHREIERDISEDFPRSKIKRDYINIFNGFAIDIEREGLNYLISTGYVADIYPIRIFHTMLNDSVRVINADDVWMLPDSFDRNITGVNTTVAIIDTGIDYTHVDFGRCNNTNITGNIQSYSLESNHSYSANTDYNWTITMPG